MIIQGNCLEKLRELENESVNCIVTSPPYFALRDYGVVGQLGLEDSPEEYVAKMVEVFREVRRVLRKDGTCWLNLGDSYATRVPNGGQGKNGQRADRRNPNIPNKAKKGLGIKPKDLMGIPWRVAFALQADGWYLRQDIIWHKPNPMPESVTDRCTKAHEYIFLLSKSPRYYFNEKAIKEPGTGRTPLNTVPFGWGQGNEPRTSIDLQRAGTHRKSFSKKQGVAGSGFKGHSGNTLADGTFYADRRKRSVWSVASKPYKGAHFATFPEKLIEPCILAGCPEGGVVLDPFMGAGTTAIVARKYGRNYLGIELNPEYIKLAEERLRKVQLALLK